MPWAFDTVGAQGKEHGGCAALRLAAGDKGSIRVENMPALSREGHIYE
jgi:hypothetical protein